MQSAVCQAEGEQGIGGFGANTVLKKQINYVSSDRICFPLL